MSSAVREKRARSSRAAASVHAPCPIRSDRTTSSGMISNSSRILLTPRSSPPGRCVSENISLAALQSEIGTLKQERR